MTTPNSTVRPDVALEDEDQAHWVLIHPEVLQAAPHWAQRMSLHFEQDGSVGVGYDAYFGSVEIGTASIWKGGDLTPCDNGFVDVYLKTDNLQATTASLSELSRRFAEAAEALAPQKGA